MKKVLFAGALCLMVSVGFLMAGCGPSETEAKAGSQTTCPMSGNPVDKKGFVDHNGKRIYFCCNECPKKFEDDADAMMKKMADAGVILEDTPE